MAPSPTGPWVRLDKPVIDVGSEEKAWDSRMVSNPAVAVTADGNCVALYKGVDQTKPPYNGIVRFGVADHPLGPFEKRPGNIFNLVGYDSTIPFIRFFKSIYCNSQGHYRKMMLNRY